MEMLIIFALLIAVMFFMSSRTRKQQRAAAAFRDDLTPGNQVMTGSGMFGTVVDIDGDAITLESPSGDESVWLRSAIAKLAEPPYAVEQVLEDDTVADLDASALDGVAADEPDSSAPDRSDPPVPGKLG